LKTIFKGYYLVFGMTKIKEELLPCFSKKSFLRKFPENVWFKFVSGTRKQGNDCVFLEKEGHRNFLLLRSMLKKG